MFEPIPEMHVNVPKYTAKSIWYDGQVPTINSAYADYLAYNRSFLALLSALERKGRAIAIPTAGAFCGLSAHGSCRGLSKLSTLYYDSHHLNTAGAEMLMKWVSLGS